MPRTQALGDPDVKTYTFDLDTDIPELQLFEEADKKEEEQEETGEDSGDSEGDNDSKIPQKSKDALEKIDKDPEGYLEDYYGNYPFRNQPNAAIGKSKIPNQNVASYKEWDINPYQYGKNRGGERIVTGSDGSAWYTPDHYKTWYQIR